MGGRLDSPRTRSVAGATSPSEPHFLELKPDSRLVNTAPFIRDQIKNLVKRFPAKHGFYFSEFGFAGASRKCISTTYAKMALSRALRI